MTSIQPPSLDEPDQPPQAPQRATGADPAARAGASGWPPWAGAAALVAAFVAVTLVGGVIILAWNSDGGDIPPGALQTTTYLQDLFFIGAALLFAGLTARPTAADFGLVATRFWRALRLAVGVGIAFYVLSAIWIALIGADASDDVSDLGVEDSTLLLITGAILLTVLAPLAEEILFRGLVFRGLRNRTGVWPAALLTGALFGLIHAGSSPIEFLVPLAFFGVGLCLLYHLTASLYPCIALHSINNTLAFGALQGWDWEIPVTMAGSLVASLALARALALLLGGTRQAPAPAV